jgi:hypothetical protein
LRLGSDEVTRIRVPFSAHALSALAGLLVALSCTAACSGSSFHVTSANEAVGRAPSAEAHSEEATQVETGSIDLSECPTTDAWTSVFESDRRFAVDHPRSWTRTKTPRGTQLVHPNAWLSLQLAVHEAVRPLEAQREHRDFEFDGAELLAAWSDKARSSGRMSDGVLRVGDQMLIVRYLVGEAHFLEAIVATDRPLDEDCRKQVLRVLSSVRLIAPGGASEASKSTPPGQGDDPEENASPPAAAPKAGEAGEATKTPGPEGETESPLPLDLRPQRREPETVTASGA